MTNHPITPPRELVEQWLSEHYGAVSVAPGEATSYVATKAAQWGADQELEAMLAELKALHLPDGYAARLRAARRPKPPSLKEQAFAALKNSPVDPVDETLQLSADAELIIRRALEALPND